MTRYIAKNKREDANSGILISEALEIHDAMDRLYETVETGMKGGCGNNRLIFDVEKSLGILKNRLDEHFDAQ